MSIDPGKWSAEFADQPRELSALVESQKAGVVAVDSRFDADGLKIKIEFLVPAQHVEATLQRWRRAMGARQVRPHRSGGQR